MASCCVAFGPNNAYFLSSTHNRSINNLPPRILSLFTTEPKANYVHDLTLGPDGSHAIIFNDASGIKIRHGGLPPELQKWLLTASGTAVQAARDLGSMRITLGAHGAYFAFDKNGAAWSRLPSGLDKAVSERRDGNGSFKEGAFPQSVALGPEGTYVMTTVGGGGSWSLGGQCRGLSQFLKERDNLMSVYVALSPCNWGVYVVVTATGDCIGAVPDLAIPAFDIFSREWRTSIQTMLAEQNYRADLAWTTEQQRQPDFTYAEQNRYAEAAALVEKTRLAEMARAEQSFQNESPAILPNRTSISSPTSQVSPASQISPVSQVSPASISPPVSIPARKSVSSPVTLTPQTMTPPAPQPPQTPTPPTNPVVDAATLAAQREAARARRAQHVQTAVTVGKTVVKGLGLLNNILNVANGGSSGGGTTWVPNTTTTTVVPDFGSGVDVVSDVVWTPVQGAASDAIQ